MNASMDATSSREAAVDGRPTMLIPRVAQVEGVDDIQEQLIRSEAFSRMGMVRMIHPAQLTPAALLETLTELLARPPLPDAALNFNGLAASADALAELLAQPRR